MPFWRRATAPTPLPLDRLGMLEAAAALLADRTGLSPAGLAGLCFRTLEEDVFPEADVADDGHGFSWRVMRQAPGQFGSLVTELKAVIAKFIEAGVEDQILCSIAAFRDADGSQVGLVYLHKRGTFYPFAPMKGQTRNTRLELTVKDALDASLPIERDLTIWFPIWGAPVLDAS